MRPDWPLMGCAQTSPTVKPLNQIPIERVLDNRSHPTIEASPVVMVTAVPTPSHVKSALKKCPSDKRPRTDRGVFLKRKAPASNKTVNFDEQVLVKPRTPTPNKTWYEKSSSTMPMRKHPRNDDDDYDYDDEESPSDEERNNDQQIDRISQLPKLGSPKPLLRRDFIDTSWYKADPKNDFRSTNTILQKDSFVPQSQQASFSMNPYATDDPISSSVNRIKVRRKMPDLGPPQILPSYQSSSFTPTMSSNQTLRVGHPLPNANSLLIEPQSTFSNTGSSTQPAAYVFNHPPTGKIS